MPETDLQRFVAGFNIEQVYDLGQHLAFCERHDDATEPPEDTSGSAEHLHEDTVFSAHNFASHRWHWNQAARRWFPENRARARLPYVSASAVSE